MVEGITSRKDQFIFNTRIGDSEKVKGAEFLNMLSDYYHDDEVVRLLISKVDPEDFKHLSHKS